MLLKLAVVRQVDDFQEFVDWIRDDGKDEILIELKNIFGAKYVDVFVRDSDEYCYPLPLINYCLTRMDGVWHAAWEDDTGGGHFNIFKRDINR